MPFPRRSVASTALLLLMASAGFAQTPPANGPEFRVNTYATAIQRLPSIAMDGTGHYVVVWDGASAGDSAGIMGRRYRSSGEPLGPQFQVNSATPYDQYYAAVGADAAGNFVVVWQSAAGDGDGYGLLGRRFGPDGTPLGAEFAINGFTTGNQLFPDVAVAADGSFVVAWDSEYQDGDYSGIVARRFNSAGAAIGGDFVVNTYVRGYQYEPTVRFGNDGSFVVVWHGEGPGDYNDILARRYDPSGAAIGSQFRVNNVAVDYQVYPSLSIGANNEFVVAWESYSLVSGSYDVFARRFDASGNAIAPQFQVNTYTTDAQFAASVALDDAGSFLVTWSSALVPGDALTGIRGRHYDASGVASGSEFAVNTYTTGNQQFAQVAARGPGDFVVVWEGEGALEGDAFGIGGQRFGDLISSESVESGGLLFWSSAQTDGGDLSVQPAAALASSAFGIEAQVDDTAGLFVQDDAPNDENRYRARFYLDPNGFDPGEAATQRRNRVFIAFEDAPQRRLLAIVMRRQLGVYALMGRVRQDDNSQIDTGFTTITDAPHWVEIDWQRATGPATADGTFQMWIDGTPTTPLTGMDNSAGIDFVRLGSLNNKSAANGTVYVDEFVSRRTNAIGPVN